MRHSTTNSQIAAPELRSLVRLAALVAALLPLAFGPGDLFATEAGETTDDYIVQGRTVERVKEIVAEVGGEVTHELRIIRAVGARLTDSQRDTLAEHPEISRVWRDREAEVQTVGVPAAPDRLDGAPALLTGVSLPSGR